ncbi:MAG: thiamine-phosphate kinase [Neisseriaceae bacterium]|nr:thiamine-phosphate kinase [Neisseriaceae bacterium]
MNEFDFIRRYLNQAQKDSELILSIGDDAAILRPNPAYDLHISADMLVENRHFFAGVDPADLAHKTLAVNLSDMAAMGAKPRWAVLSVALPELDAAWLKAFCDQLFALANEHGVQLIGGDTTKGPLTLNVTIIGQTPKGQGLRRSHAKVGDDVWVSGQLGLAACALHHHLDNEALPADVFALFEQVRNRPTARVALGRALLPYAHAAQDVSDGLAQDVQHILAASGVGARIDGDAVPTHDYIRRLPNHYAYALAGGDDYELLFTAPTACRVALAEISHQVGVPITKIGTVTAQTGLQLVNQAGEPILLNQYGFDHFS